MCAQQVAEQRPSDQRAGQSLGDGRNPFRGRAGIVRQGRQPVEVVSYRLRPLAPALAGEHQEDLLARLEVAQHRGLVHADRAGDVGERDRPDAAFRGHRAGGVEDRSLAGVLRLRASRALELVSRSHAHTITKLGCVNNAPVFD